MALAMATTMRTTEDEFPEFAAANARASLSRNPRTAGLGDAQGENGTRAEAKGRPRLRAATAAVDGGVPVRAAPGALETK